MAGVLFVVLVLFLGTLMLIDRTTGSGASAPDAASGNAAPGAAAPGGADGAGAPAVAPPPPPPPPQLPRGGTTIFPRYRVVAQYGSPGTESLGVLGEGTPEQAADRVDAVAAPFATPGREIQPAMEIIVSVADGSPGDDGTYHHDIDQTEVRRYLEAARAHRQLVILDIQPGRATFPEAVRPWLGMLREPDVGLALDPEWRMGPDEVPGKSIGKVSADEVNQVVDEVAAIVRDNRLPQKLFLLHQFVPGQLMPPEAVRTPPELATVQHVDGFGGQAAKIAKYRALQRPQQFHMAYKLFYDEDIDMMTPQEALSLSPPPELLTYQ